MSQKWQDAMAWDESHLRGALLPARWVLRVLSSGAFIAAVAGLLLVWLGAAAARVVGTETSAAEVMKSGMFRAGVWLVLVSTVIATTRRVEFTLRNAGIVGVSTGVVALSLGCLHFGRFARHGDILLQSSAPSHAMGGAFSEVGPPESVFFDADRLALYVHQGQGWEAREIENLPARGNHNLGAAGEGAASSSALGGLEVLPSSLPALSIEVPRPPSSNGATQRVDPKIGLRAVGYAARAEERADWIRFDSAGIAGTDEPPQPLRFVSLHGPRSLDKGGEISDKPGAVAVVRPTLAKERHSPLATDAVHVEYTLGASGGGMSESRWQDLSERLPLGAEWGLVLEVAGADGESVYRHAFGVNAGDVFVAGQSGYRVEVKELNKRVKTPIVAPGYLGCDSSEAVLRIVKPDGSAIERRVYHRYPEIMQDWSATEATPQGMPGGIDFDRAIRVSLIDCSVMQVYLDESPETGKVRGIVRQPAGEVRVVPEFVDGRLDLRPELQLRIGERWADSRATTRPAPLAPTAESHAAHEWVRDRSMLAVEVTHGAHPGWRRTLWLPVEKYFEVAEPGMAPGGKERSVELPDGTRLWLVFGRQRSVLPSMELRLAGFRVAGFDERGEPDGVEAKVNVSPTGRPGFAAFDKEVSSTREMTVPFAWSQSGGWLANALGTLRAVLDPSQFSLRVLDWDVAGWKRTQSLVEAGRLAKPQVAFVTLEVWNGPGVSLMLAGLALIAAGSAVEVAWRQWRRVRSSRGEASIT